jgi:UDPglucose 6-dehydrogenase
MGVRREGGMNVAVCGLWHLGSVTAACAAKHFPVVAFDPSPENIENLSQAKPPVAEPGLSDLIKEGLARRSLRFTTDRADALRSADMVWVTFDTPVSEDDVADVNYVRSQVQALFPFIKEGSLVLISSQLPVGTTRQVEHDFREVQPGKAVAFAYSPENLRLGKALEVFQRPERIVAGIRSAVDRSMLEPLLRPFCETIEWMGVESAEMVKHSINAFLATSVTFINEIATVCERVGADAKEVERGLKSDQRIGVKAYLGAGGAFSGGTLARDITFLSDLGRQSGLTSSIFSAVRASNNAHKNWGVKKLEQLLGGLQGKKVAVLGLTYKPGTDTLRRSAAVDTCRAVASGGGVITAFDPAVKSVPNELASVINLAHNVHEALLEADALYVGTEWPEFKNINAAEIKGSMKTRVVIDQSRFLHASVQIDPEIVYAAIGLLRRAQ